MPTQPSGLTPRRIDFFFYGTLRDRDVRRAVLGPVIPAPEILPATLDGHRVAPVDGGRYPILVPDAGSVSDGLLVRGVDLTAAARASFFEGEGYDYGVGQRPVAVDAGPLVDAWVYLPSERLRPEPGTWLLADWERRHRSGFLANAHRAMRQCRAAEIARHRQAWLRRLAGGKTD